MTLWAWLLIASAVAYATKIAGYLVPARALANDRMTHVAGTLTIGLLASLTATNAFTVGQTLVLDARAGSLVAAALALWGRVPFLGVVVIGALTAAVLRAIGWT